MADIVVNAPVEAALLPMAVPSIVPPFMSTVASVACPDVVTVVKAPEDFTALPIVVPSIAPPFISTVVNVANPDEDKVVNDYSFI